MTDAATKMTQPPTDHAELARRFHDTYERLAPSFGYETRPDTKAFDPESPNGRLMTAVCKEVEGALLAEIAALRGEKDRVGRVLTTMQEAVPPGYHPNGSGLRLFIADLKDRAAQAERQRDEAREALRPFAEAADNMDGDEPDGLFIYDSPESTMISYGDLRAAKKWIASMEPKT